MRLGVEKDGDVTIVRVSDDRLTSPMLATFFGEVRDLVHKGARKVVLDFEAVSYVDSATIGCLMDLHRLVEARGGSVKLAGLHRRVRTLLSMTGVLGILDVHDATDAALAAFAIGEPPPAREAAFAHV
jgi:anti-anti-sigma factor